MVEAMSVAPEHLGLAQFVDAHRGALRRVAVGITRDPALAEDLVQDTVLRLLPRWERVESARSPWAYVRTTMVRLYLDQALARATETPTAGAGSGAHAHDDVAAFDAADAAVAMLRDLSPRARAVLTLRYIEDLDDREIARVLHVHAGSVRVIAHRALRQLRVQPAPTTPGSRRS